MRGKGFTKVYDMKLKQTLMVITDWLIWKMLNGVVFENEEDNSSGIIDKALRLAREILETRGDDVVHVEQQNTRVVQRSVCEKPSVGWLKVNFDGAFGSKEALGVSSFVVREWEVAVWSLKPWQYPFTLFLKLRYMGCGWG